VKTVVTPGDIEGLDLERHRGEFDAKRSQLEGLDGAADVEHSGSRPVVP
jgi:hypothetical protein